MKKENNTLEKVLAVTIKMAQNTALKTKGAANAVVGGKPETNT
jgi:hypothetical protein